MHNWSMKPWLEEKSGQLQIWMCTLLSATSGRHFAKTAKRWSREPRDSGKEQQRSIQLILISGPPESPANRNPQHGSCWMANREISSADDLGKAVGLFHQVLQYSFTCVRSMEVATSPFIYRFLQIPVGLSAYACKTYPRRPTQPSCIFDHSHLGLQILIENNIPDTLYSRDGLEALAAHLCRLYSPQMAVCRVGLGWHWWGCRLCQRQPCKSPTAIASEWLPSAGGKLAVHSWDPNLRSRLLCLFSCENLFQTFHKIHTNSIAVYEWLI